MDPLDAAVAALTDPASCTMNGLTYEARQRGFAELRRGPIVKAVVDAGATDDDIDNVIAQALEGLGGQRVTTPVQLRETGPSRPQLDATYLVPIDKMRDLPN